MNVCVNVKSAFVKVFIHEFVDANDIVAAKIIFKQRNVQILLVTFSVDIINGSFGRIKLALHLILSGQTTLAGIIKSTGAPKLKPFSLRIVISFCKILIHKKAVSCKARLVTLFRVCAGVSDHDALQVNPVIFGRSLSPVILVDRQGQIRHIDACITLSCYIKVSEHHLREFNEKGQKSLKVVLGH